METPCALVLGTYVDVNTVHVSESFRSPVYPYPIPLTPRIPKPQDSKNLRSLILGGYSIPIPPDTQFASRWTVTHILDRIRPVGCFCSARM